MANSIRTAITAIVFFVLGAAIYRQADKPETNALELGPVPGSLLSFEAWAYSERYIEIPRVRNQAFEQKLVFVGAVNGHSPMSGVKPYCTIAKDRGEFYTTADVMIDRPKNTPRYTDDHGETWIRIEPFEMSAEHHVSLRCTAIGCLPINLLYKIASQP